MGIQQSRRAISLRVAFLFYALFCFSFSTPTYAEEDTASELGAAGKLAADGAANAEQKKKAFLEEAARHEKAAKKAAAAGDTKTQKEEEEKEKKCLAQANDESLLASDEKRAAARNFRGQSALTTDNPGSGTRAGSPFPEGRVSALNLPDPTPGDGLVPLGPQRGDAAIFIDTRERAEAITGLRQTLGDNAVFTATTPEQLRQIAPQVNEYLQQTGGNLFIRSHGGPWGGGVLEFENGTFVTQQNVNEIFSTAPTEPGGATQPLFQGTPIQFSGCEFGTCTPGLPSTPQAIADLNQAPVLATNRSNYWPYTSATTAEFNVTTDATLNVYRPVDLSASPASPTTTSSTATVASAAPSTVTPDPPSTSPAPWITSAPVVNPAPSSVSTPPTPQLPTSVSPSVLQPAPLVTSTPSTPTVPSSTPTTVVNPPSVASAPATQTANVSNSSSSGPLLSYVRNTGSTSPSPSSSSLMDSLLPVMATMMAQGQSASSSSSSSGSNSNTTNNTNTGDTSGDGWWVFTPLSASTAAIGADPLSGLGAATPSLASSASSNNSGGNSNSNGTSNSNASSNSNPTSNSGSNNSSANSGSTVNLASCAHADGSQYDYSNCH